MRAQGKLEIAFGVLQDLASTECQTPGVCGLTGPWCLSCRARRAVDIWPKCQRLRCGARTYNGHHCENGHLQVRGRSFR